MIDDKECKIVCSWLLPGPDSWKRLKSWLRCKGIEVEEDRPGYDLDVDGDFPEADE